MKLKWVIKLRLSYKAEFNAFINAKIIKIK